MTWLPCWHLAHPTRAIRHHFEAPPSAMRNGWSWMPETSRWAPVRSHRLAVTIKIWTIRSKSWDPDLDVTIQSHRYLLLIETSIAHVLSQLTAIQMPRRRLYERTRA